MKICVMRIWHLGAVTSACLASLGHTVVGLDENEENINRLNNGQSPIFEPNLDELIKHGIDAGHLSFSADALLAVHEAEVLWVAFDTPVDESDIADIDYVLTRVKSALRSLPASSLIIVSSQLPVGTIAILELFAQENYPNKFFIFASIPENLRLGKALDIFLNPDRLIVGIRSAAAKIPLQNLLSTITKKIEWMSTESAEMTKHAINAFLATSVTFANEVAAICELVGADAKEVERGLKTESRIGPKAYLSPGGPFAGGTLARDIVFLGGIAKINKLPTPLLSSVLLSNDAHKNWVKRKLLENFTNLKGKTVAIWGLTYKVGTDTLRRSLSVDLCDWLLEKGAIIHVVDPVVKVLPAKWKSKIKKFDSPMDSLSKANVLVVGTEWPQFRDVLKINIPQYSIGFVVIDANRFLKDYLDTNLVKYIAVGSPKKLDINIE